MKTTKYSRRRRGSNLIEFAIVLPILLTLSLMLVQYGIIMYTTISLANLSRDAARYGAVNPTAASITSHIQSSMPPNLKYADITTSITTIPANSFITNSALTVSISYNMSKKLFLPANFVMGPIKFRIYSSTFTTSTSMRIE